MVRPLLTRQMIRALGTHCPLRKIIGCAPPELGRENLVGELNFELLAQSFCVTS